MKTTVKILIKEVLTDALRESQYNLAKAVPRYPRGGCSTSRQDVQRAYEIALMKLQIWQSLDHVGKSPLPATFDEFKKFLDADIAKQSFMDAITLINRRFSDRNNAELVKEMREDIEELKRLGISSEVSTFEYMLKQKIGEE